MGYELDVLRRAKQRHAAQVEEHRQRQRRHRAEVYARMPEVRELDREIAGTVAQVVIQSLRHGEDPTEEIQRLRETNQRLQQRRDELLRQAGYPPLEDGPLCQRCSDSGYVGTRMCGCLRRFCQEEQRRELTSLLTDDASFDEFSLEYYPETVRSSGVSARDQMDLVYEVCVNFARHFQPGRSGNLLFSGGPGLGKTFLSACIAREVVEGGYSVVYQSAFDVFSSMEREKFGEGGQEDARMVRRLRGCDLLILDDLGTELKTSFVVSALYQLINSRLTAGKPMIISTNLNMNQISDRYSQAIASRLDGCFRHLTFMGVDIRRLKK